ncbi:MAG: DNA helicase RecQ [Candidatus Bipolaricaulota bacterium]|nr:DNA helicase RecQ [Candidatus Bipolaricaulota bacterium]
MLLDVKAALKQYWGYDEFLPLQERAIESVLSGRDSIVVLPTGGGKSICFQAPAVTLPGMAIVVSPLISLMKDQIDALTECGVPAARIDSSQSTRERDGVIERVIRRELKLLYIAPERFAANGFINFLRQVDVSLIAIDEAHCVSMWGHDFRPEYRRLGRLKEVLPGVAVHAYTATATGQVRSDIALQLHLVDPEVLIGSFDRPNLVYRVKRRTNAFQQVRDVLARHRNESVIIYCIRRADVDDLCAKLIRKGYRAVPYHAGMNADERKAAQDTFIAEEVEIIVATVAFGMGIDKSNVRAVIHTGMPKSLEHYQQESGRAGRDGLEAECSLFWSGGDYGIWKSILANTESDQARDIALSKLNKMYDYCTGLACRHRALVNYFGQDLEGGNCGACDVCLGEIGSMDGALEIAQKILSCVVRLHQRFGADYTASVLSGSRNRRILERKHDSLSTYGLLSDLPKNTTRDWIEQLVGQGYLERTGEYNVLHVAESGWRVLHGEEVPRLLKPAEKHVRTSRVAADSWEGVDHGLFEALRGLRRELALKRNVPAYVVFSDAALRGMARLRPSTPDAFLRVSGVGSAKAEQYGDLFLGAIGKHCREHSLSMDVSLPQRASARKARRSTLNMARQTAYGLFARGISIEEAARVVERVPSTVVEYLISYITKEGLTEASPWVDKRSFDRIADAAASHDPDLIGPIYRALGGEITYDSIKITLAVLKNRKQ